MTVFPTPLQDKHWTDQHGTLWHMRGGTLAARQARRLLNRTDVPLVHVYGPDARELTGPDRAELASRIEDFFAGNAPSRSDYVVAEFRNDQRQVMLVVQEYC
jgi:hypothetical protein